VTNDELNELLKPLVADLGLEFVGIEFSPSRGSSLLRVFIDAPERPVTIEDCERVSREISAQLDVNDPIEGRYTLEVSSPGIDRPLFTLAHFERYVGSEAKISVALPINGRHRFSGTIRSVDGDRIHVDQDGQDVAISHVNVVKARLVPDYVALGISTARCMYGSVSIFVDFPVATSVTHNRRCASVYRIFELSGDHAGV
jgi:ribosome maturation factor RimP